MQQPTLPLLVLPFPLVLLPGARATFPLAANIADALIRLVESSPSNPVLAAVPVVQNEGNTFVHKWGVTARITRFVRPRAHSDEPHLLTLTGIARIRLANLPPAINGPVPLPHIDVSYPPPDTDTPPAADVVQDFKAAAIRLLERFAQDTSQAARKRESWSRIAQLVDETEPQRTAALADAIISAVGAEHADKIGEFTPPLLSDRDYFLLFLYPATATALSSDALWFWTLVYMHADVGFLFLARSCYLYLMTPALPLPTP